MASTMKPVQSVVHSLTQWMCLLLKCFSPTHILVYM